MRSNLQKSMLAVFAMAVATLFVGTLAMAAPTFSGGAGVGFGQVGWDTGASGAGASGKAYNTQIESNLIASGANETKTLDYYFRLRVRGTQGDPITKQESEGSFVPSYGASQQSNNGITANPNSEGNAGGVQTARVRVGWNPADTFRVEIGKLPSIGVNGLADIRPVRAPANFRHPVNNYAFFDVGAINLQFHTGGIKAGVAIGSACDPSCTKQSGDAEVDAQTTLLPYFAGTFGALKIYFRAPSSSGKVSNVGTQAGLKVEDEFKTSATVLEAAFDAGVASFATEIASTTYKSPVSGSTDFKNSAIVLSAIALNGALQVQYSTSEDNSGSTAATYKKPKTTLLNASYMMDVGGGARVGPEYATVTKTASTTTGKDQKGTLIRLMFLMNM